MFKSQLVNAGLFLSNYLQNVILEEPTTDYSNQHELDKNQQQVQDNRPPNLLKSIFDSGRPYFRLDYSEAFNNIRCLVLPVGKVKQLVPDLYIPSVSASTFMIASSVLLCLKSKGKMTFGDALSKTLTKFVLVNLSEIVFLSALLYFISYASNPQDKDPNAQKFTPQPNLADLTQAYGPFVTNSSLQKTPNFQNSGNFSNFGNSQSPIQGSQARPNLNDRMRVRLPEVLFVIGYKYVLVNYFLLITTLLPFKVNTVLSMIYVSISSLIFSVRSVKSLRSLQSNSSNPLIFIFPVLQPLFFYILLPSRRI